MSTIRTPYAIRTIVRPAHARRGTPVLSWAIRRFLVVWANRARRVVVLANAYEAEAVFGSLVATAVLVLGGWCLGVVTGVVVVVNH